MNNKLHMSEEEEESVDDELLKITFGLFDEDKDGKLDYSEFSNLIKAITTRVSIYNENYAKILFLYCDIENEKYISYENLKCWWNSSHKLEMLSEKKHIVEHAYMLFMTYSNGNVFLEKENFAELTHDFNFNCDYELIENILIEKNHLNFKDFTECMNWFKENEVDDKWSGLMNTRMMKKYKKKEFKTASNKKLFTWT